MITNKLIAKFRVFDAERYISVAVSKTNVSGPESFVWKDVNWKKVQLRLNNLQNKIFAAKKENNISRVRKLQIPNKRIGYRKFWHKVNNKLQFSYKKSNNETITIYGYREIAKGYSIVKYVKIKGEVSVYNGNIGYWSRRSITPSLKTKTKTKLLKRQEDKCAICNLKFFPSDIIETDHIKPIAKGGKHVISNLQLVHASPCHDYKKY